MFKLWEGEKVQTLINGLDQIVLEKGKKRNEYFFQFMINGLIKMKYGIN